jgi:hypothetical protein
MLFSFKTKEYRKFRIKVIPVKKANAKRQSIENVNRPMASSAC